MKFLCLIFTVLVFIILITTNLGAAPILSSRLDSGDNAWNRLNLEIKNPGTTPCILANHSIEYYMYEPGMNISDLRYEIWDNGGISGDIQVSFMDIIPAYINEEKKADIICRIIFPEAVTLATGKTIQITIGIRQEFWQPFTDEDDWSYHPYWQFEENQDILLFDSANIRIAGDIPPFINAPWKGAPIYWLGKKTEIEIDEYDPREGDGYQSVESGINYIFFEESWRVLSQNPFSKTTTISGEEDDPIWEMSNIDGNLVFSNIIDNTSPVALPSLKLNLSGDVIVEKNIISESGIFNSSFFLGQDAPSSPAAPFHIQNEDTNCFLDTQFADAIIEGNDGRLQLAAKNNGKFGASIIMTNYSTELYSNVWQLAQDTMIGFNPDDPYFHSGRLSFNFGKLGPDGFDLKEVMSVGTATRTGSILDLKRIQGYWPDGPATGITVSKLRSTDLDEPVYALRTEYTNQFIWAPINKDSPHSGIYFAADDHATWKSGDDLENPFEIVFVGWGEKRGSISLRDGKASFNTGDFNTGVFNTGVFNSSIYIGQDTTTRPAAPFHIQSEKTGCTLDSTDADAIIEGDDGRLQIAAKDKGADGASILLTTYNRNLYTSAWLISQQTHPNYDRLSFNFGDYTSHGFFDIEEVMALGTGARDSGTLELKRYAGNKNGIPVYGSATAIKISRLRSREASLANETVFALQTQDTNQFIWSPIDGNDTDSGIYFASDDNAEWQSGNNPDNPNEIVFVGWGKKRASISLRDGTACFDKVKTSELILDQDCWADYVFEEDYEMMKLSEVEGFIEENGHLPGVPSAEEVAKTGISIGESQVKLLEKIEELTLYMIEQQKEITTLKTELIQMKSLLPGNGEVNE